MDLRPIAQPPSPAEIAALDAALPPVDPGAPVRTGALRHLLLPALHALQARVGWVSPGGLGEACRRLHVPPAEGYGVASFYAWYATKPRPPRVVHVCDDLACKARGAGALTDALTAELGRPGATPASHPDATWLRSPCLGLCDSAPAALLQQAGEAPIDRAWGDATADGIAAVVRGADAPAFESPRVRGDRLLRRIGKVDPTSLDAYVAAGGGAALRLAVARGSAWVIGEITASKLVGRGGAAFPSGRKWAAVAGQPVTTRWLVCNADESEPGTFKDRFLLEQDPFALVEAMAIAGIATGCERGVVYLRAEYPLAYDRVSAAILQCRASGWLGPDVAGSGLPFELEIRRGAGAYICGEETALLESIEGKRGEPRSKPPFPVEVGLFGLPTLIHNVETLANVPDILLQGGEAFARIGTPGSTGTRLFCLSGHVAEPMLIEAPFGVRVSELIAMAGGVSGGRGVGAVLLGGAAGTFIRPDELDLPLTFEDVRAAGATMGSGVILVLDDATDLVPYLQRIASFFRDESCGQCVPCRVGTVRQEEWLARLARGARADRALLAELGQCMRDASICGLGQTASSAIESAFAKFPALGATS